MGPVDAKIHQLSLLEPLELRHLPDQGLRFEEALTEAWLAENVVSSAQDLSLTLTGPGWGELEIMPLGPVETRPPIVLRGNLKVPLKTPCVRCLEDVALDTQTKVELTLFPPDAAQDDDDPGSAEAGTYEGGTLPLPEILRETLLLAIDMNPCCADEPACDARTAQMLAAANKDVLALETSGDPRWAALAALKKTMDEG